jgi:hypothetical protein
MKQRKYCIQFIWLKPEHDRSDTAGLLIEQLRHAGLLDVMSETDTHYVLRIRSNSKLTWLNDNWNNANCARMQSFGLNAEVVPEVNQ